MGKAGDVTIEAVADVSKFAAQLQKDLNAAIAGIRLNADQLGDQLAKGIASGVDKATGELRRIGNEAGTVSAEVADKTRRAADSTAAAWKRAGQSMSEVGQNMSTYVTLPVTAAGYAVANTAGDFEAMMNRVKAATETTGPVFDALRKQAIDLGSSTKFSASEAADGMRIMATAGFNAQQIMAGLPAVLDLAAAGSVDLSTAAEIAGDILNGFGFQAKDLSKVNDILARDFLSTATDLTDLGLSFKYIGPIAKAAGLSFEETAAAVGLLGNAGIKGEQAGTTLRGAMASLLDPSKEVSATLRELGVTVTDSSGKLLPLVDIIGRLKAAGADTSDIFKIFGREAGSGMQALITTGAPALAALTKELSNAGGTAQRVADTQMQGLNGSMDNLKSSVEGLMIAIGDAGLLGALTRMAQVATTAVNALTGLPPVAMKIVTVVGAVLASIGPVLLVAGKLAEAIGFVAPYVTKLVGALGKFRIAAGAFFATPAGWVVLAITAIVAAMVLAYNYSERFRTVMQQAFTAVGQAAMTLWTGYLQPAFQGIVAGAKLVWVGIQAVWAALQPVFAAIGNAVRAMWSGQVQPVLTEWAAGLVSAGNTIRSFWTGYVQPAVTAIVGWFQTLGAAVSSWWTANGASVFAAARGVFADVGMMVKTVFSAVVEVFRSVGQVIGFVFSSVLVPAGKLVVSVIKTIIDVVVRMKPLWIVLGAVIGAAIWVVIQVVKLLWNVIVVAFKAIAAVISWLWGSIVKPVFSFIGAIIKTVASVILWLWNSVISPVFKFIGSALGAVGSFFIGLWNVGKAVFSAIGSAVSAVAGAFRAFWGVVGPLFSAIGNLISSVWNGVISVVFELFKGAWALLAGAFKVAWTVLSAGLQAIGAGFRWLWDTAISPVVSAFGSAWQALWGILSPVFSAIGSAFTFLWNAFKAGFAQISAAFSAAWATISSWGTSVMNMFTSVWNWIVSVWNGIGNAVRSGISAMVTAAGGLTAFVNSITANFNAGIAIIRSKVSEAVGVVQGLPGRIVGALGNLGGLLYGAGQNVINGLINGIESRIQVVRNMMSQVTGMIRDHLPFSPAKIGPLSGRGDPTISGGKIVNMLAEGMDSQLGTISDTASSITGAVRDGFAISAPGGIAPTMAVATPTATNSGATVVNNFTINALAPDQAASAVMAAISAWEARNGKVWRTA